MKGESDDVDFEALVEELKDLEQEFWDAFHKSTADWKLQIGPVALNRYLGSQAIARVFIAFCVACLIFGAGLTFFTTTRELGVAIVVGVIFAGGSFVVQFWAVQVQNERQFKHAVMGVDDVHYLRTLLKRHEKLAARIERRQPRFFETRP